VLLCDEFCYCGKQFAIKYALLMVKPIVGWTKVTDIYTVCTETAFTSIGGVPA
jgi:hypothetical protein